VNDLFVELFPNRSDMIDEYLLNDIGYHYLGEENLQAAIEILKWNVQEFPTSWNVFDSLGEAYKAVGNTELSIENYEKSIELNPENEAGMKILEELKKG